jgi:hypothetical protein
MLAGVELRDLGARVHLFDADFDDLGFAHAPRPVDPGDLIALADGSLAEIVCVHDLERRAVDAVFRECPVIVLPGYRRPLVRVRDYLALLEGATYCDRCGDRVRP